MIRATYDHTHVFDATGWVATIFTTGISLSDARSILGNNGLLDEYQLKDIAFYYFHGDKYFYQHINGEYVCEYSNQSKTSTDFNEMVDFVKALTI